MEQDYSELYQWVEEHAITRPKRNINRDFSDALPLVEILKHHFPKLVDVHNYVPRNSAAMKLINWQILNEKVLKKLRVGLTKKRIEMLVNAEVGAIEKLLLEIKQRIDQKAAGDDSADVLYVEVTNSNVNHVKSKSMRKKTVTSEVFEKLKSDLTEKVEAVEILQKKVDHLEGLLTAKDEQIKNLTLQLENIINQKAERKESAHNPQKIFGLF